MIKKNQRKGHRHTYKETRYQHLIQLKSEKYYFMYLRIYKVKRKYI